MRWLARCVHVNVLLKFRFAFAARSIVAPPWRMQLQLHEWLEGPKRKKSNKRIRRKTERTKHRTKNDRFTRSRYSVKFWSACERFLADSSSMWTMSRCYVCFRETADFVMKYCWINCDTTWFWNIYIYIKLCTERKKEREKKSKTKSKRKVVLGSQWTPLSVWLDDRDFVSDYACNKS